MQHSRHSGFENYEANHMTLCIDKNAKAPLARVESAYPHTTATKEPAPTAKYGPVIPCQDSHSQRVNDIIAHFHDILCC